MTSTPIVSYVLDNETTVDFEIESAEGFQAVSSDGIAGRVRDAVEPAIEAARTVLGKAAELCPAEVQVTFGVRVNGTANWVVAKAATEAHFAIALTWRPSAETGEVTSQA
ncbi:CU044_2847 family protein [Streptomyces sp. B6B3]|uniref:CU044_2847 family protein n=1 Tax=Streptomyces sp. B6B3 TaxID=3153570 RepID=UPI00325D8AE8